MILRPMAFLDPQTRVTRNRFLALLGGGAAWLYAPAAARAAGRLATAPATVWSFTSRTDLKPPVVRVSVNTPAATPGYAFMAPASGVSAYGPLIVDSAGDPVWFRPSTTQSVHDFRVQELNGEPVLTWWEGTFEKGYGEGEYVILDSTYTEVGRVSAANGYAGDLHEFTLTPSGTALISAYNGITADLSSVGGPADGTLLEGVVQEVDVATGKLLFEWHSHDHVGLDESYLPNVAGAWDYFHLNSIDLLADGNYLISARHTSTVYKLDRATGDIVWRLGGKKSDFQMGAGTAFAFQHDARGHDGGVVSIFDDGGYSNESAIEPSSRAIYLTLDENAMTAELERAYAQPEGLLAFAMGNTQLLANGNTFVGWGLVPVCSEFSAAGDLVFNASTLTAAVSYRTYRGEWTGTPPNRPVLAVVPKGSGVDLFVSWNGATEVARWRVSGGTTRKKAKAIHTVRRTGFETRIHVPSPPPVVYVSALDAEGNELATSHVARIPA